MRGQQSGQRVRADDGCEHRDPGQLGRIGVAADGEHLSADRQTVQKVPDERDDAGSSGGAAREGEHGRRIAERLHAFGHAVERLSPRDAEIDALEDRQGGQGDDEGGDSGPGDQTAVQNAAEDPDDQRRAPASGGGKPQTCIIPAKEMAARPPMAPTAKFIWPMAMMIICDSAITVLAAIARRGSRY